MNDDTDLPFCGCREALDTESVRAWGKRHLRYVLTGSLPGLPDDALRQAFAEATTSIAACCDLTFAEVTAGQSADIVVTTGHIDGPGQVLAWSELPDGSDRPLRQRYDASDRYVVAIVPPAGRIDLVAVATHELIHACGLDHAAMGTGDLMEPTYRAGRRTPQTGDVRRLVGLYGPPVARPVPPAPTPGERVAAEVAFFDQQGAIMGRWRLGERIV